MILAILTQLIMKADCERFLERHVIADSPYTEEQEREYFSRLEAIEQLYNQYKQKEQK